jgi:hypothetical protein
MNRRLRIFQVETQVLSQGLYSSFRGIVGSVPWRICDTLLTTRDNDGRGVGCGYSRLERRDECVQPVDNTEEVGIEYLHG